MTYKWISKLERKKALNAILQIPPKLSRTKRNQSQKSRPIRQLPLSTLYCCLLVCCCLLFSPKTTSSQTLIIGYVFWRSFDDSIYIIFVCFSSNVFFYFILFYFIFNWSTTSFQLNRICWKEKAEKWKRSLNTFLVQK